MMASAFMVLAAIMASSPPDARSPRSALINPSSLSPTKPDDATKRRLWAEGCRNGSQSLCYNYALMLRAGIGGPANPTEAHRLIHTACERGLLQACREERSDQK